MGISTIVLLIAVFGLVILFFYVIGIYNALNTLRVRINASIQEIGNQLKRQAERIPNLTNSAKGYIEHEQGIFDKLTEARKMVATAVESGDPEAMIKAGSNVSQMLPTIQAVFESNPQIKASEIVSELMNNLRDTSDKVTYSRRLFIDLTADYNQKIVVFPSNLVAGIFGFKAEKGLTTPDEGDHIKVSAEETKTPEVDLTN